MKQHFIQVLIHLNGSNNLRVQLDMKMFSKTNVDTYKLTQSSLKTLTWMLTNIYASKLVKETLYNIKNYISTTQPAYHDVTSSNANNTPPTGALKAAATPAAHPQVTFSKHNTNEQSAQFLAISQIYMIVSEKKMMQTNVVKLSFYTIYKAINTLLWPVINWLKAIKKKKLPPHSVLFFSAR